MPPPPADGNPRHAGGVSSLGREGGIVARILAFVLLLPLIAAACAKGGGPVGDQLFPSPNAAVPSPNDLRTCPRGVGCY